jgi:hypothetical protein
MGSQMNKTNAEQDMDLRRAARHRAAHTAIAESKAHGDQKIHIVNVSAHGFMIDNNSVFSRGDRIELRLPAIGRIEAHLIWAVEERAGFQFERVVRLPDFLALLEEVSPTIRKS